MDEIKQSELKDRLIEQLTQENGVLRTNLAYQNLVIEELQKHSAPAAAPVPNGDATNPALSGNQTTVAPDVDTSQDVPAPVQTPAPVQPPAPDVQTDVSPNNLTF